MDTLPLPARTALNPFRPFDGVMYRLTTGPNGDAFMFETKEKLLAEIAGYEPIWGVEEVEWDGILHRPTSHVVSEYIAQEYVARYIWCMLDDNLEPANVDPFFATALREAWRATPGRSTMNYSSNHQPEYI